MGDIIDIVGKSLYTALYPVRKEMIPTNKPNCLLVKKKAEFFLNSLPTINNSEVDCVAEGEYFFLAVKVNTIDEGECNFTLMI